jgi:hypothetical protein
MADNNIIDDKTLKKQEESNALLEKYLSINQKLKEKKKELESILKSIKLYEEETLSLIDKGTIKGNKQINNRQKDLDILLKQRDTIKKELSSAKEREKSYKRMNDIHSGMKSVSSGILRDAKEETNWINTGLSLKNKWALLKRTELASSSKANEIDKQRGQGAKIIWEMQKRLNSEVEDGIVKKRTAIDLEREYKKEMESKFGNFNKDIWKADKKLLNNIIAQTKKYSKMTQEQIQYQEELFGIRTKMKEVEKDITDSIKDRSKSLTSKMLVPEMKNIRSKIQSGMQENANLELIERARAFKKIWEMQKRLNSEVEDGIVEKRTAIDLERELNREMGSKGLTKLTKEDRTEVLKYIESISRTTKEYEEMNAEQLSYLNEQQNRLAQLNSGWDSAKETVFDLRQTVVDLFASPAIAGTIFAIGAIGNAKKLGESMIPILNTGLSIQNVTGKMGKNMTSAWMASLKYGAGARDIAEATQSIVDKMGSIDNLTKENITGTVKLMKLYGMGSDEAAALTKQFDHIGKLTGQTNEQLRRSVAEMANLGKVAPTKVFQDLADNSEAVAKWIDESGTNMTKLSVSANQLGLSMGDISGITEGILDFSSSIENQMRASVMTGKQFNFEQARSLAFAGKHDEALKSIVSQLGTEEEFLSMNAFQRQSMADMLGVSVDQLKTMIINQDKLGKKTGKYSEAWGDIYGRIKGAFSLINKDNIMMAASGVSLIKNVLSPKTLGKLGEGLKTTFAIGINSIKSMGGLLKDTISWSMGPLKKLGKGFLNLFPTDKLKEFSKKLTGLLSKKASDVESSKIGQTVRDRFSGVLPKKKGMTSVTELKEEDRQIGSVQSGAESKTKNIDQPKKKGGIADWIKSWDDVKWGSIAKIAASLAILGVAIYGFGKVISSLSASPGQYVASGFMLVALLGSIKVMGNISKKININDVVKGTVAMAMVSSSLWLFSKAISSISGDLKQMAIAGGMLVSLIGSILTLSIISKSIGLTDVIKGASAMAIISAALVPFAFAMKLMADVEWKTLGIMAVGLITITAAMIGLGALLSVAGPFILAGVAGLIAMSVGLLVFGAALIVVGKGIDSLTEVDWKGLTFGTQSLAIFGATLMSASASILSGALAMIAVGVMIAPLIMSLMALSVTLGIFGKSIGALSDIDWDILPKLGNSLSTFAMSVLKSIPSIFLANLFLPSFSLTLLLFSRALKGVQDTGNILTSFADGLNSLSTIDWKSITKAKKEIKEFGDIEGLMNPLETFNTTLESLVDKTDGLNNLANSLIMLSKSIQEFSIASDKVSNIDKILESVNQIKVQKQKANDFTLQSTEAEQNKSELKSIIMKKKLNRLTREQMITEGFETFKSNKIIKENQKIETQNSKISTETKESKDAMKKYIIGFLPTADEMQIDLNKKIKKGFLSEREVKSQQSIINQKYRNEAFEDWKTKRTESKISNVENLSTQKRDISDNITQNVSPKISNVKSLEIQKQNINNAITQKTISQEVTSREIASRITEPVIRETKNISNNKRTEIQGGIIKPEIKSIDEFIPNENSITPITEKSETKTSSIERNNIDNMSELSDLVKEVKALRKFLENGSDLYLDGKKVQRILANVTGIK